MYSLSWEAWRGLVVFSLGEPQANLLLRREICVTESEFSSRARKFGASSCVGVLLARPVGRGAFERVENTQKQIASSTAALIRHRHRPILSPPPRGRTS